MEAKKISLIIGLLLIFLTVATVNAADVSDISDSNLSYNLNSNVGNIGSTNVGDINSDLGCISTSADNCVSNNSLNSNRNHESDYNYYNSLYSSASCGTDVGDSVDVNRGTNVGDSVSISCGADVSVYSNNYNYSDNKNVNSKSISVNNFDMNLDDVSSYSYSSISSYPNDGILDDISTYTASTYTITESIYSNYFDSEGKVNTIVVSPNSILDLSGTFYNKNFIFSMPLTITSLLNNAYLYNCSVNCTNGQGISTNDYFAKISNLHINDTTNYMMGIFVDNSSNVLICDNDVFTTGTSGYPIFLHGGSTYCNITNNKVETNIGQGGAWQHPCIILGGSDHNYIAGNDVTVQDTNGIYLSGYSGGNSHYNMIFNNTVRSSISNPSSWSYGIQMMGDYNTALNNTVYHMYRGVSCEGKNNSIIGNKIYNITGQYYEGGNPTEGGDYAIAGASNTLIVNNTISNCNISKAGIYLGLNDVAYNNSIEIINGGNGVQIGGSDAMVYNNSIKTQSGYGIQIGGSDAMVYNNSIKTQSGYGIYAAALITNIVIMNNTVDSGSGISIYLYHDKGSIKKFPVGVIVFGNNLTTTNSVVVNAGYCSNQNFIYKNNNVGADKTITLPSGWNQSKVVTNSSFFLLFDSNGNLKSDIFDDNETLIFNGVIANLTNVNTITIGKTLKIIGNDAVLYDLAMMLTKNNISLENISFNISASGIHEVISVLAENISLANNIIDFTAVDLSSYNYAIYADSAKNLNLTNNTVYFTSNSDGTAPNYGVNIVDSENALIENNTIVSNIPAFGINWAGAAPHNPLTLGVILVNSNNSKFIANNITTIDTSVANGYNTIYGVLIQASSNVNVSNNNISTLGNNYLYGLSFDGYNDANKIVHPCNDIVVENNIIKTNSTGHYANGIQFSGAKVNGNISNNQIISQANLVSYTIYASAWEGGHNLNFTNNNISSLASSAWAMELDQSIVNIKNNNISAKGNYTLGIGTNAEANITDNHISVSGDCLGRPDSLDSSYPPTNVGILSIATGPIIANNNFIVSTGKYTVNLTNTGSSSKTNVVSNNYLVSDSLNGDSSVYYSGSASNNKINDNYGESSDYKGIIYVSINGNNADSGNETNPKRTIAAAIASASADGAFHEIIILAGTYEEYGLTISSDLKISAANGANVIIDSKNKGNIITIDGGSTYPVVNLVNLSFINGNYTEGGAIYNGGILTILNCNFENNTASLDYGKKGGGAICCPTNQNHLIVINSTFKNNGAYEGGAIASSAKVDITNSSFDSNYAENGGAIYKDTYGELNISGSKFFNNHANLSDYSKGGAIYLNTIKANINYCAFINNTANQWANDFIAYSIPSSNNPNLSYNYWGSNNPDFTNKTYLANSPYTIDNWVILTVNNNASSNIYKGDKINFLTNFNYYTNGVANFTLGKTMPDGIPVDFTGNKGTFNPSSNVSTNAKANSVYSVDNVGIDEIFVNGELFYEFNVMNHATTIYVSANGNDANTGLSKTSPKKTIANALSAAGDNGCIIILGTIKEHGIAINQNIYLKGEDNGIIDGESNQIIRVGSSSNSYNITIQDLSLINGKSTNGGAIESYGNLTIVNSIFENNSASQGAIIHVHGNLSLSDSKFNANNASEAVIYLSENSKIIKSVFTNNKGQNLIKSLGELNSSLSVFVKNDISSNILEASSGNANLNWWGSNNNASNRVNSDIVLANWVIMTVTTNATSSLRPNQSINIAIDFNHCTDSKVNTTFTGYLPSISLSVNVILGNLNGASTKTLSLNTVKGVANLTYTANKEGDENIAISSGDENQNIKFNVKYVYTGIIYIDGTNGNDANSGNSSSPKKTIASAIDAALVEGGSHQIIILAGTYKEHDLFIKDDLNISTKANVIIDGENKGNIFTTDSGTSVNLVNMTLINGKTDAKGGAIYVGFEAYMTLNNVNIYNSTAGENGGAICNYGYLKINNSEIKNNKAVAYSGGAIYNYGNLTIENSLINDNSASQGGAISNYGDLTNIVSNLFILNSSLANNYASSTGGAIHNQGNMNIFQTAFINNSATNGGAIYSVENGVETNVSVTYSVILNNSANDYGSGICLIGGKINAKYNWWGSNNGSEGLIYISKTYASIIDSSDYVIMTISPENGSEINGTTANIIVSLNKYLGSDGRLHSLDYIIPSRIALFTTSNSSNFKFGHDSIAITNASVENTYNGSVNTIYVNIDNQVLSFKISGIANGTNGSTNGTNGTNGSDKIASNFNADNVSLSYGDDKNFTATLTTVNGTPIANQNVTITISYENGSSTNYTVLTNSNGLATLPISSLDLNIGNYTVSGIYLGNDNYSSSSFKDVKIIVNYPDKIATTLIASNSTFITKSGENYTIKLVDQFNRPVVGQEVVIKLINALGDSKIYWATTNTKGIAKLQINLAWPGIYNIEASYGGKGNYTSNASNASITIVENLNNSVLIANNMNTTSLSGKNFTATLKDVNGSVLPGREVSFTLFNALGQNKTYWGTTNTEGIAKLPINLAYPSTYYIVVNFPGYNNTAKSNTVNASLIITAATNASYNLATTSVSGTHINNLQDYKDDLNWGNRHA